MAVWTANLTTVRLSSGISANILDFGIPQKHVVKDMKAMETGRKAGAGEVRDQTQAQAPIRQKVARRVLRQREARE